MATKTLISAEEYLNTPFHGPEPDYLDGELIERAMPTDSHSLSARNLNRTIARQDPSGRLHERPEIRIRTAPDQFRVVDLVIYDIKPSQEIPPETPLAAIEILSPADSHAELMRKFEEFERLGVKHIWLVDPLAHRFSRYHAASLTDTPTLAIPEHNLTIRLNDIFE